MARDWQRSNPQPQSPAPAPAPPARRVFTSFAPCERANGAASPLAPHDFALYGEREVMGILLGVVDGLKPAALVRSRCDFGAAAGARLRRELPDAECVVSRHNGTAPLVSVRGSVSPHGVSSAGGVSRPASRVGGVTKGSDAISAGGEAAANSRTSRGCFFLDQEHPPNDGEPQPKLSDLYPGAGAVAKCLRLSERRDGRRPGVGPVCQPRGGWDGDFREEGSPWGDGTGDGAMESAPNRGAGRRRRRSL